MKKITLLILGSLLLTSCGNNSSEGSVPANQTQLQTTIDTAIKLVLKQIKENNDKENKVELYTYSNQINQKEVEELCTKKKNEFTNGSSLQLIFFDNEQNAVFPENGTISNNNGSRMHVKAIYDYDRVTGKSELIIFSSNMGEAVFSKKTIKI